MHDHLLNLLHSSMNIAIRENNMRRILLLAFRSWWNPSSMLFRVEAPVTSILAWRPISSGSNSRSFIQILMDQTHSWMIRRGLEKIQDILFEKHVRGRFSRVSNRSGTLIKTVVDHFLAFGKCKEMLNHGFKRFRVRYLNPLLHTPSNAFTDIYVHLSATECHGEYGWHGSTVSSISDDRWFQCTWLLYNSAVHF